MKVQNQSQNIAEILLTHGVFQPLKGHSKEDVFGELILGLQSSGLIESADALREAVFSRESVASTACGAGIAIPHARMPGLPHILIAVGTSVKGIQYITPDGSPVKIFFLIAGPSENPDIYLRVLSQIARMAKDEDFRKQLLACSVKANAIEVIRKFSR